MTRSWFHAGLVSAPRRSRSRSRPGIVLLGRGVSSRSGAGVGMAVGSARRGGSGLWALRRRRRAVLRPAVGSAPLRAVGRVGSSAGGGVGSSAGGGVGFVDGRRGPLVDRRRRALLNRWSGRFFDGRLRRLFHRRLRRLLDRDRRRLLDRGWLLLDRGRFGLLLAITRGSLGAWLRLPSACACSCSDSWEGRSGITMPPTKRPASDARPGQPLPSMHSICSSMKRPAFVERELGRAADLQHRDDGADAAVDAEPVGGFLAGADGALVANVTESSPNVGASGTSVNVPEPFVAPATSRSRCASSQAPASASPGKA